MARVVYFVSMRARSTLALASLISVFFAASHASAQDTPVQPPPPPPQAAPPPSPPPAVPANAAPANAARGASEGAATPAPSPPKTPVVVEAKISGTGGSGRAWRPKKKLTSIASGGPVATYPGFHLTDAGSRVLVEVSRKVDVGEHKAQGRITYRLKGVAAPTRTNRLPLLTGFFPTTPVSKVQLVEASGDVDLVIDLRAQSDATYKVADTPKGGMVLQIDFPKLQATTTLAPPSQQQDADHAKRGTDTTRLDATSAY